MLRKSIPIRHIGAISGGKDSICMAMLLKEQFPDVAFEWIFTPTLNEPPEFFAHMVKMSELIGPIKPVMYPGGLAALIAKWNALPNYRQRWCTRVLKIEPFAAFLMKAAPATFYVGLRADEESREGGDYLDVPGVKMCFPLRDADMDIHAVRQFNAERGILIPKRTDCMVCFFQRLIEWWELWKHNPKAYAQGETWENSTGHTFRSAGRDSQPASLRELRLKFEAGYIPKDTRDPIEPFGLFKDQCRVCRK